MVASLDSLHQRVDLNSDYVQSPVRNIQFGKINFGWESGKKMYFRVTQYFLGGCGCVLSTRIRLGDGEGGNAVIRALSGIYIGLLWLAAHESTLSYIYTYDVFGFSNSL